MLQVGFCSLVSRVEYHAHILPDWDMSLIDIVEVGTHWQVARVNVLNTEDLNVVWNNVLSGYYEDTIEGIFFRDELPYQIYGYRCDGTREISGSTPTLKVAKKYKRDLVQRGYYTRAEIHYINKKGHFVTI